jgi:hypothetical protein
VTVRMSTDLLSGEFWSVYSDHASICRTAHASTAQTTVRHENHRGLEARGSEPSLRSFVETVAPV